MEAAIKYCTSGIGIWEWASNDKGTEPDVVTACCGDVPTIETLGAFEIIREQTPDLRVRVINVADLMTLQPKEMQLSTDPSVPITRKLQAKGLDPVLNPLGLALFLSLGGMVEAASGKVHELTPLWRLLSQGRYWLRKALLSRLFRGYTSRLFLETRFPG